MKQSRTKKNKKTKKTQSKKLRPISQRPMFADPDWGPSGMGMYEKYGR